MFSKKGTFKGLFKKKGTLSANFGGGRCPLCPSASEGLCIAVDINLSKMGSEYARIMQDSEYA